MQQVKFHLIQHVALNEYHEYSFMLSCFMFFWWYIVINNIAFMTFPLSELKMDNSDQEDAESQPITTSSTSAQPPHSTPASPELIVASPRYPRQPPSSPHAHSEGAWEDSSQVQVDIAPEVHKSTSRAGRDSNERRLSSQNSIFEMVLNLDVKGQWTFIIDVNSFMYGDCLLLRVLPSSPCPGTGMGNSALRPRSARGPPKSPSSPSSSTPRRPQSAQALPHVAIHGMGICKQTDVLPRKAPPKEDHSSKLPRGAASTPTDPPTLDKECLSLEGSEAKILSKKVRFAQEEGEELPAKSGDDKVEFFVTEKSGDTTQVADRTMKMVVGMNCGDEVKIDSVLISEGEDLDVKDSTEGASEALPTEIVGDGIGNTDHHGQVAVDDPENV